MEMYVGYFQIYSMFFRLESHDVVTIIGSDDSPCQRSEYHDTSVQNYRFVYQVIALHINNTTITCSFDGILQVFARGLPG